MLLTIHDANLKKVAFIDNNKYDTLNYFNDTWTRYLETASSTFDFTVFKKSISSDVRQKRAYNYLNEKSFVSFQYDGRTYLHTIRKIEENEKTITCYGINLNLELINEYANPYKANRQMLFVEYCNEMDLLNFAKLSIGINEISDKKLMLEWDGQDTKLSRLLSLATKFGAELDFDTRLNSDSSIKDFKVNIYHENDDDHQGVGENSSTILKYGKNMNTLMRTVDKTNIYNMVRPTGTDENGNVVTISGLDDWSVVNEKGEREFYQFGEGLYAPLSMQMYPSTFTSTTTNDQWIRKDMTVDSSNPDVIRAMAYRELKKNAYPNVTYEVDGFGDLGIGDTVQIYDDGFHPILLVKARVSEQTISFTNPKNNKTTFSNFKKLENIISKQSQSAQQALVNHVYSVDFISSKGTILKNGEGETTLSFVFKKDGINSSFLRQEWYLNDELVSLDDSLNVDYQDLVDEKAKIRLKIIVNSDIFLEKEISIININDGAPASEEVMEELATKLPSSAIDLNANGTVTKSGAEVTGDTYATMIAADPTWAQKIGDKVKVNSDMIVDGAVTANKLTVDKLSALSADLGNITGGTIFLANEYLAPSGDFLTQSFSMSGQLNWQTVNTTAGTLTNLSIEGYSGFTLQENKIFGGASEYAFAIGKTGIAFSTSHGAAASGKMFSIGFDGSYTIVNADYIKQNVRVEKLFALPYGLQGRLDRIGDVVTLNVVRKIVRIDAAEYQTAFETLPYGFRPPSESVCLVAGNSSAAVNGTMILYFRPDGSIRFTNGTTGSRVWSGTSTWITGDRMPVLEAVSN